jgi:signal transduction histidine kinase
MTRGVEAVAEAARRVTEGNLDVFISPNTSHDWEVKALVQAISEMLTRIRKHIALERQFAAYAAHELRSPLAALKGELELALRRPRSKEEYETALRSALEDTNRLVALSEDLLVYARSAGDPGMTPGTDVSLAEVIHDSLKTSLGRVQAKVPFKVECPDVRVQGNPRDLARALRNLLDNAIVHAPPGSVVSIACTRASENSPTLNIDISDWGDGVPDELVDNIFQPFVRAPRERGRSGAGLGLAIARETARRNGGELLLVSASNPTCFRLILSLATSEPPAEAFPLSSAVAIERSETPTLAARHT